MWKQEKKKNDHVWMKLGKIANILARKTGPGRFLPSLHGGPVKTSLGQFWWSNPNSCLETHLIL